jgi:hypothetical protein
MNMYVNDLILNACVKTTEMYICEKILTTSGNKIYYDVTFFMYQSNQHHFEEFLFLQV